MSPLRGWKTTDAGLCSPNHANALGLDHIHRFSADVTALGLGDFACATKFHGTRAAIAINVSPIIFWDVFKMRQMRIGVE